MKSILFILFSLYLTNTMGQTFDGVPIRGHYSELVNTYKKKNYKLTESNEESTTLRGKTLGKEVTLYITYTPKSKQVYGLAVIYDEEENPEATRKSFESLIVILSEKYGTSKVLDPNDEFMNIILWDKDAFEIRLGESSNKQVVIAYRNKKNATLYTKEKNELEKATF